LCLKSKIAGWEYQNWTVVIGLPILIFFAYLSQPGFTGDPPSQTKNPNENPRPKISIV
jgi:hypothetical protein